MYSYVYTRIHSKQTNKQSECNPLRMVFILMDNDFIFQPIRISMLTIGIGIVFVYNTFYDVNQGELM